MGQAKNAQEIFVEVVEKVPRNEWPDFLARACGSDYELRSEVQRLIKAYEDMGDFMNRPAISGQIAERTGDAEEI